MRGDTFQERQRCAAPALALLASLACWVSAAWATGPHTDHDPILIEYHRYSSKLAERDPTPLLRLYASGRLLVHFPHYMKRAGEYETALAQAELDRLLDTLASAGFVGAQAGQTARRVASAQSQQLSLHNPFYRSETTISHFVVYTGNPVVPMTLRNLQSDARRMGTAILLSAAAAERQLLALTTRAGLKQTDASSKHAGRSSP